MNIVRLLLENGASVNHRDGYGQTALMRASRKGHTDVVKLLLEHGADVNIVSTDEDAATALHFASEEGKINVVKLLLQSCADTTIKNVCCT
jgi:ankyrin repeat protein